MSQEIWKLIEGTKYQVSNHGRVKSRFGKILKPQFASNTRRYLQVRIYNGIDARGRLEYVHRLVAQAFIGDIPKGYEVNHINCDTLNNHVSNLEIVTPHQNMTRYWTSKHSYNPDSNKPGSSRLTPDEVREIRRLAWEEGKRTKDLAAQFGVWDSLISRIKHRHTWAWLD